jgi:hypothetical protein
VQLRGRELIRHTRSAARTVCAGPVPCRYRDLAPSTTIAIAMQWIGARSARGWPILRGLEHIAEPQVRRNYSEGAPRSRVGGALDADSERASRTSVLSGAILRQVDD